MKIPSITLNLVHDQIAELYVTNDSPMLAMATRGDGRLHVFGVADRPRFLMERPYSPDDAWGFEVDPLGGLAQELPLLPHSADAEIEAFLERQLEDPSRKLLHALPSGRYALVRSRRELTVESRILLGNELVAAPPNALVLGLTGDSFAAAFGATPGVRPNAAGLFVGVAVLAYNGHDTMEGMWLFDLSGVPGSTAAPSEMLMVLPLAGPFVIDALAAFRDDGGGEARQRWAGERGAAFVRWCAGK